MQITSDAIHGPGVRELGLLMAKATSNQRAFAVTNLGQLDGSGAQLGGTKLKIESFFGDVTGIVDSSVLTPVASRRSVRLGQWNTFPDLAADDLFESASLAVGELDLVGDDALCVPHDDDLPF